MPEFNDSGVQDAFDRIAPGWYNFRHRSRFLPELTELATKWQKGKLLNIGCAHGPDFIPFKDTFELYGIDLSAEMLKLAQKYAFKYNYSANLVQADARTLPFADESYDWAIAVATYHHIQGRDNQLKALRELWRVLRPGGEAFMTVWNRWQPQFWLRGAEIDEPWRIKDEIVHRYHHLFSYGEFGKLLKEAGFTILSADPETGYKGRFKLFSRNICVVCRRG